MFIMSSMDFHGVGSRPRFFSRYIAQNKTNLSFEVAHVLSVVFPLSSYHSPRVQAFSKIFSDRQVCL